MIGYSYGLECHSLQLDTDISLRGVSVLFLMLTAGCLSAIFWYLYMPSENDRKRVFLQ